MKNDLLLVICCLLGTVVSSLVLLVAYVIAFPPPVQPLSYALWQLGYVALLYPACHYWIVLKNRLYAR